MEPLIQSALWAMTLMPRTPNWDDQIENVLEFFMIVYPNALLRPNPR